jgi:predicted alpha/beta superfamily hydrolase
MNKYKNNHKPQIGLRTVWGHSIAALIRALYLYKMSTHISSSTLVSYNGGECETYEQ